MYLQLVDISGDTVTVGEGYKEARSVSYYHTCTSEKIIIEMEKGQSNYCMYRAQSVQGLYMVETSTVDCSDTVFYILTCSVYMYMSISDKNTV